MSFFKQSFSGIWPGDVRALGTKPKNVFVRQSYGKNLKDKSLLYGHPQLRRQMSAQLVELMRLCKYMEFRVLYNAGKPTDLTRHRKRKKTNVRPRNSTITRPATRYLFPVACRTPAANEIVYAHVLFFALSSRFLDPCVFVASESESESEVSKRDPEATEDGLVDSESTLPF